jgi:hypothetical protein
MLDIVTLKGPGGIEIIRGAKGWHRWLYNYLNKGEIRGVRPRNIAANASGALGHNTRTVTMYSTSSSTAPATRTSVAGRSSASRRSRAAPSSRSSRSRRRRRSSPAAATVHLGVPTGTLEIWAHIWDVDAKRVIIPAIVLESVAGG